MNYIWINLDTKFHFKQTTFNFRAKYAQIRYFWSKIEKSHSAWLFLYYTKLLRTGTNRYNGNLMFLLLVAEIIIDSTTSLNIRDGVLYNFLYDFTSELYYSQYPEDVD